MLRRHSLWGHMIGRSQLVGTACKAIHWSRLPHLQNCLLWEQNCFAFSCVLGHIALMFFHLQGYQEPIFSGPIHSILGPERTIGRAFKKDPSIFHTIYFSRQGDRSLLGTVKEYSMRVGLWIPFSTLLRVFWPFDFTQHGPVFSINFH